MNRQTRHINMWPATLVLFIVMLILLLAGCLSTTATEEAIGEFDIISVKLVQNNWSGDYYLVTTRGDEGLTNINKCCIIKA